MPTIDGLAGLNTSSGTATLIAAYGNDLVNVDTGVGYSQNITSGNKAEFEQFINNLYFNNYKDMPRHFDGTSWKKNLANKMPMAKYMQRWRNNLYLGYVKLPQTGVETWDKDPIASGVDASLITFPSSVFKCDLPVEKGKLKWGTFWSSKFSTLKNEDNKLRLSTLLDIGFIDAGVKIGDPVYILSGADLSAKKYTVARVDAQNQITLLENVPVQITNATGWIGSNWFDFETEDGDFLTGLGENNDRLLVFKNYSVGRYDGNSLRKIKGIPGTTSHRSIQNLKDTMTIYFHGSSGSRTGFYMYDGANGQKISNAFEKHIAGIASSNYTQIVGWTEGELYRAYIGDLTNSNYGISLSNAVWTFDASTNTQSIDPIGKVLKDSAYLRESNILNTYLADDDSSVFLTGEQTVFTYDTKPISFGAETYPIYPSGTEIINDFTRVQVIARNARGVKVEYRLYNKSNNEVDLAWQPLGDIKYDKTEFIFPIGHRIASGIDYRFSRISTGEPDLLIEKISTFYTPRGIQHVLPG